VGKEVAIVELGRQLSMGKNTVEKYLDLLEKVFVIYRIGGFNRNLRKEIAKSQRWFFVDNGIRNALIGNFKPLSIRDDVGALWENYIVTERMKRQAYLGADTRAYFWRTYDQQELDLVEEGGEDLNGYEIKWGRRRPSPPASWKKAYPKAGYHVIHPGNYLEYISR